MTISTVLFDLGGTIEDVILDQATQTQCLDLIQHLLVSYDSAFAVDRAEFHRIIKEGFCRYKQWSATNCIEESGEVIWGDWIFSTFTAQRALFVELGEILTDLWETLYCWRKIKPEAMQVLETLKNDGYRLGVISNTTSRRIPFLLMKKYGIESYFDCMLLSSIEGIRKPNPAIFERAVRQLAVEPEQCIYIGDQVTRDCYGPNTAGFATNVLISSCMTTDDPVYDQYIGHRISQLSELPALLRTIREVGP